MGIFEQLALVLALAVVLGTIMNRLKQPAILGYMLTGILVAGLGIYQHSTAELLETFGELGVTLLLFLVGLELSWPKLQAVGKAAVATGIGQILFTTVGGIGLATLMGFNWITALYVAIAMTFSSTIIIVKLLGEKNDLQSLYGRISVGMLLVQDFVAILILVLLAGFKTGNLTFWSYLLVLVKFAVLVGAVYLVTKYIVPHAIKLVTDSTELLFVASVAWGVGLAALMAWEPIGFSIEAGGFIAGITLANAIEQHQIISRLRPLRDFFIMLFFVYLGSGLSFAGIGNYLPAVVVFSLFVLVGNPLIVILIMRALNFRARTIFTTSLTVAQISEFSLIVAALGFKLGHVNEEVVSIVTLVGVLTMTGSTYMILQSDRLWRKFSKYLKLIEKKGSRDLKLIGDKIRKNHIILVGCHRTGQSVLQRLLKLKEPVTVVDYNPHMVDELTKQGIDVVYGDAEDVDILENLQINQAKMIISTVVDKEATEVLLEFLQDHKHKRKLQVIVTAAYRDEAKGFYDKGADYVVLPRWMTGVYLGDLLAKLMRNGKQVLKDRAEWEKQAMKVEFLGG